MKWRSLPLILGVALDMAGFGMIIPDIQTRAEDMGASGAIIGLLLASTFVVQFVISPIWGARSDQLGRRNVFIACTLLSAVSMLIYGLASSLTLLFVSRILAGLGAANIAVAQASIVDDDQSGSRTAALGRLSAAQTMGLIAGPALGGIIAASFGSPTVGFVGAALSGFGVLIVALYGKFSQAAEVRVRRQIGFGLLREYPRLVPLVLLAGIAWFSLSALEGTFGRLLRDTWSYSEREFGFIFGFESLVQVIIQGQLLGILAARFRDRHLLVVGYLCQGLGLAITPFVPNLAGIFAASLLYAAGVAVSNPTVNGLCSHAVGEDRQGEVFGVIQSARSVGFMFGPILGGILYDARPFLPYLLAGGVCLAAALMVPRTVPQSPAPVAG